MSDEQAAPAETPGARDVTEASPSGAADQQPGVTGSTRLQAAVVAAARASGLPLLDAGRGQPNWTAIAPRAGFLRLGQFALAEAEAASESEYWGQAPPVDGLHARLIRSLASDGSVGANFLGEAVAHAVDELGAPPDAFVHELVRGVLGAGYPAPTRMLSHLERVLETYLTTMTASAGHPPGTFSVFATEGGAAAMAYLFRSLRENGVIGPGDAVAVATPVFTPYLQIPVLASFGARVVEVPAAHNTPHRFDDGFLERLLDPSVKVFFVINPGNPDTRAIRPEKLEQLRDFVLQNRPDLVIVTDSAYATFVDGFRGVLSVLPRHTIVIHSFSKNFGATGNRLGFVAMAADHVIDDLIRAQPAEALAAQDDRYAPLAASARDLSFMARLVADSREVALHNIAGLSTSDQVQMGLFALAHLLPSGRTYADALRAELARRSYALFEPLGIEPPGGQDSFYYALVDLLEVAGARHGAEAAQRLRRSTHPAEVLLGLASGHGVIVQAGGLFEAYTWDVRVSLASLGVAQLRAVGQSVVAVLDEHLGGPVG